ncbi:MAG: AAA family ATPase [Spirochaetaceae bacterium]|jgi:predicted AAA+ superfamily ATPase|nr:AAA family ATPase [Spirochaetaceae bacterium]
MLDRSAYLDVIRNAGNEQRAKMVAGIRHSGKSFLFYRFISELREAGIDDDHIIHFNFENKVLDLPRTAREIETVISKKTVKSGKYYIFFDEIQAVSGWEKAVNTLLQRRKFNIYISISNAAVLLSGNTAIREKKYVLINFKSLSFAEYKKFFAPEIKQGCGLLHKAMAIKNSKCNHFDNYIRYGGFPAVYNGLYEPYAGLSGIGAEGIETVNFRLNGIYSSILLNDVIRRANIRNVELLDHIINIISLNIGKENSAKKITESLRKKHYKKNLSLVHKYVKALENAFVIKKMYRCNLLTGKLMRTNVKYFMGDHALLNAVIGIRDRVADGIPQNILLHDLERRGYAVYSGKLGSGSIDFFAKRADTFLFLQIIDGAAGDENILKQKIETLNLLNDIEMFSRQKKYVLFFDADAQFKQEGERIHYVSLENFLLFTDDV